MTTTPFETHGQLTGVQEGDDYLESLPNLSSYIEGYSVEGVPIRSYQVGTGGLKVFFVASMHGNEPGARESAISLLRDMAHGNGQWSSILEQSEWTIVPTPNPWGIENNRRQNSQLIDLNRDYDSREAPESKAVRQAISRSRANLLIDGHEQSSYKQVSLGYQMHSIFPEPIRTQSEALWTHVSSGVISDGFDYEPFTQDPDVYFQGAALSTISTHSVRLLVEVNAPNYSIGDRISAYNSVLGHTVDYALDNVNGIQEAVEHSEKLHLKTIYDSDGYPLKAVPHDHKHHIEDIFGLPELLDEIQSRLPPE